MPNDSIELPKEILSKLLSFGPEEVEITTDQYLSEQLAIDMSSYIPEDKERIIRNYICLTSIIRKDI